jgi:polyisoprenoid-binding protein YceI
MKRAAICLAAVALLIVPASAAQKWKLETAKSKVGFTVNWGGQPFTGVFRSWKADIEFDPADLAHSHAYITIDTGSEASAPAPLRTRQETIMWRREPCRSKAFPNLSRCPSR